MEKNNSNDIYAILLGIAFLGLIFFILTLTFWEKTIYNIFLFDNEIASFINKIFPNYYQNHQEIYNLVKFVDIPEFEWLKLSFSSNGSQEYLNTIYNYYYNIHIFYGFSLFLLGYFIINNFHLIPIFKFTNNFLYKQKLVEEAKKRIKIYNKQIILYKNMDVLLEKKREATDIGDAGQFSNSDYYLPFVTEDRVGNNSDNNDDIKDSFIDINIINTDKRYVNDSLYFSNHYINNYYHEYILKSKNLEIPIIQSLYKIEKYWNELKSKIIKKNNIQDLYYYNIINYYNDSIENVSTTFISLFLNNNYDIEDKNYLILFNRFLKNYNINMKLIYNFYTLDIKSSKSPYIIYTNNENYNNLKELQKYEFIIDNNNKYKINLEEFYVFLKIKMFSFSINKTYFFNLIEDKILPPILTIPPSEKNKVDEHNISEIENIKLVISSLQDIHLKEFNELEIIKTKIEEYNDFKNHYMKNKNYLFENNNDELSLQSRLIDLLNKVLITKIDKQISIKEILNKYKTNYDYFYEIFNNKNLDLLLYIKNIKLFLKLLYRENNKLLKEDLIDKTLTEELENIKSYYIKLSRNIKDLFEDKNNITDIVEIEKRYLKTIIEDLQNFMNEMIIRIKFYYQYNLQYTNKDEKPEIGQPVMATFYILTPFVYIRNKNDNNNFEKIKQFRVKGYKKYIYPVFEEIYDNWYTNIEKLINFYDKKININNNNNDNDNEETKEINLKLELLKREANRQKISNSSIETKLLDIFEIHKFEETIIIALWKEFTKLENLPTTKLSNLKYDNIVLWYALTCIGDVEGNVETPVIGRPFDYNAGLPILLMYELEKENYKRKIDNINFTKHNLEEKD